MNERNLNAAAFEAGGRERPSGFGGGMAETKKRDSLGERKSVPCRFVEDAHVLGKIGAREQRCGRIGIVVPRRYEYGFAQACELFEEEANRLRTRPLGFIEIAADRQGVGPEFSSPIDDAHERVGEGLAAAGAAARLGEDGLEVDVRAVNDRVGHRRRYRANQLRVRVHESAAALATNDRRVSSKNACPASS